MGMPQVKLQSDERSETFSRRTKSLLGIAESSEREHLELLKLLYPASNQLQFTPSHPQSFTVILIILKEAQGVYRCKWSPPKQRVKPRKRNSNSTVDREQNHSYTRLRLRDSSLCVNRKSATWSLSKSDTFKEDGEGEGD